MAGETVLFSIFLIFTGAAILATIALFTRQSLLVAYIILGAFLGPHGFELINDASTISQISTIGIIFLLFLLGLNLHPQNLLDMLKNTTMVTVASSTIFFILGFFIARMFGHDSYDSVVIGSAMMFSSTIIGLKLLPTTVLHHQRMGEVIVSVLLLQDLIAIIVLLSFHVDLGQGFAVRQLTGMLLSLPLLIVFCFVIERMVLRTLLLRFDRIQEYIFLLAIGWCLGIAELAEFLGLSFEIGAFIAGVTVATSPIALFIAESLKPLRDFFLVMFFFSLGASFNFSILPDVWLSALVLAGVMLLVKPILFWAMFKRTKESARMAREIGFRLGQVSEFSLLIAHVAKETNTISATASYLIQATTILTFMLSSYYIVKRYPTPIAMNDNLRKD